MKRNIPLKTLLCTNLILLSLGFFMPSSFSADWQVKWEAKELPHEAKENEWQLHSALYDVSPHEKLAAIWGGIKSNKNWEMNNE